MNRLDEIETRLKAIKSEVEVEGADLVALNTEVDALIEERKGLLDAIETRKQTLEKIASLPESEGEPIVKEDRQMADTIYSVDSKEYRSAWLKNLQGKTLDEIEQRSFAQSGSPVPTLVADKFVEKLKKLAPMMSEITLFRVKGNLKVFVEDTRNAAYKHTENAAITESGDTFATVTLGGTEFAKLVGISKSAAAMSIDAFEDWLVSIIAGDIARQMDNYILNDATNGLAAASITVDTISAAAYTYGSVLKCIADLDAAYDPNAKFYMHKKTLYNGLANIVNSAGDPIFVPDTSVGVGRIMGYPVVLDDYITSTKNPVFFGDATAIYGNLSEDVTVDRDDHYGFGSGTIYFRGWGVFDSKVANTDAFVKLILT